jgi:hypothetical protein
MKEWTAGRLGVMLDQDSYVSRIFSDEVPRNRPFSQ